MASVPDLPSPPGGSTGHRAASRRIAASAEPVRYVYGLLLGQGIAWLVLAGAWLGAWIVALPPDLKFNGGAVSVYLAAVKLFAIATACCVGSAEVEMACRLRGGPRLVLVLTTCVQGAMLAAVLILAALLIMVGGSMLQLVALG